MEEWVVWVVLAALLAVGEIFTLGFFLAPFAGGALVAAIVAGVGLGTAPAVIAFLAASAALLLGLRPIAKAHLRPSLTTRTGTARLVGTQATVVEAVGADAGCVKLDGEIWTARTYDDEQVIEAGTRVTVIEIKGATALVSE